MTPEVATTEVRDEHPARSAARIALLVPARRDGADPARRHVVDDVTPVRRHEVMEPTRHRRRALAVAHVLRIAAHATGQHLATRARRRRDAAAVADVVRIAALAVR